MTGYSPEALARQIELMKDFEAFFDEAPVRHPHATKITGVICGVRIQEIENPLMRKIRYMDKLVDELATGRPIEKILRTRVRPSTQASIVRNLKACCGTSRSDARTRSRADRESASRQAEKRTRGAAPSVGTPPRDV